MACLGDFLDGLVWVVFDSARFHAVLFCGTNVVIMSDIVKGGHEIGEFSVQNLILSELKLSDFDFILK